ncbi:MAG: outer membrane lipoprotein carrier protein LolA [Rickettsiales bacterium]
MRACRLFLSAFFFVAAFCVASGGNAAANARNVAVPSSVKTEIIRYLDGIESLHANFSQTDEGGVPSSGEFYMERPSKIRWEYAPPSHLLIIVNGKVMAIVDRELDEVRNVPIESKLAGLLALPAKNLFDASSDVLLTDYKEGEGAYFLSFAQKNRREDGEITLHFSKSDVALTGFSQRDPTGRRVEIVFSDMEKNLSFDRNLFYVPEGRSRPQKR